MSARKTRRSGAPKMSGGNVIYLADRRRPAPAASHSNRGTAEQELMLLGLLDDLVTRARRINAAGWRRAQR